MGQGHGDSRDQTSPLLLQPLPPGCGCHCYPVFPVPSPLADTVRGAVAPVGCPAVSQPTASAKTPLQCSLAVGVLAPLPSPHAGWHCHLPPVPGSNLKPTPIAPNPSAGPVSIPALRPHVPGEPCAVSRSPAPPPTRHPISGPRHEGGHRAGSHCAHPRHAPIPQPVPGLGWGQALQHAPLGPHPGGLQGWGCWHPSGMAAPIRHSSTPVLAPIAGCTISPHGCWVVAGACPRPRPHPRPGAGSWQCGSDSLPQREDGGGFFHETRAKTCHCLFSPVPEGRQRRPQRRQSPRDTRSGLSVTVPGPRGTASLSCVPWDSPPWEVANSSPPVPR